MLSIGFVDMSDVDILCDFFFFQAEDGIRDLVRSRGLGDVYKRQIIQSLRERYDNNYGPRNYVV